MYQFIPIKDFALSWRWLDNGHTILPDDVLDDIRPLSEQSAKHVTAQVTNMCNENASGMRIRANSSATEELARIPIRDSEEIFVSWSPELVVITTWRVFRKYWEDFCYPSSDEVSIWSAESTWQLCYFHYELFIYVKAG